jgi:hypothetical protein
MPWCLSDDLTAPLGLILMIFSDLLADPARHADLSRCQASGQKPCKRKFKKLPPIYLTKFQILPIRQKKSGSTWRKHLFFREYSHHCLYWIHSPQIPFEHLLHVFEKSRRCGRIFLGVIDCLLEAVIRGLVGA